MRDSQGVPDSLGYCQAKAAALLAKSKPCFEPSSHMLLSAQERNMMRRAFMRQTILCWLSLSYHNSSFIPPLINDNDCRLLSISEENMHRRDDKRIVMPTMHSPTPRARQIHQGWMSLVHTWAPSQPCAYHHATCTEVGGPLSLSQQIVPGVVVVVGSAFLPSTVHFFMQCMYNNNGCLTVDAACPECTEQDYGATQHL